jgi:hypothetical protein
MEKTFAPAKIWKINQKTKIQSFFNAIIDIVELETKTPPSSLKMTVPLADLYENLPEAE